MRLSVIHNRCQFFPCPKFHWFFSVPRDSDFIFKAISRYFEICVAITVLGPVNGQVNSIPAMEPSNHYLTFSESYNDCWGCSICLRRNWLQVIWLAKSVLLPKSLTWEVFQIGCFFQLWSFIQPLKVIISCFANSHVRNEWNDSFSEVQKSNCSYIVAFQWSFLLAFPTVLPAWCLSLCCLVLSSTNHAVYWLYTILWHH